MQEPPLVKGHPIFGHLFQMKKEGIHFYERMFRENGDAMRIRVLHKTFYLFLHPEHNREILIDKGDTFIKGNQYKNLRLILGNGLLTSNGQDWQKQRKLLNPIFGRDALDIHLQCMTRVAQEKVESLSTSSPVNWTHKMFEYTIDVAIHTFFGTSLSPEQKERFNRASVNSIRIVSRRMATPFNWPLFFPTKDNKSLKADLKFLKETVYSIIERRKKQNEQTNDLLGMMMCAQDDDKTQLSRSDIFDQILTFLFAGHETTAMTMSWLFYELSRHPDVQNKIIEECEKNNFEFSNATHLSNYPYLNKVLNETMRLYPAGWIIARDIAEDSSVGKFKVKKNRVLAICPFVNHRDSRWWIDPQKFIPERFEKDPIKNSYLPFSLGKRNCIGGRFATLEMAIFCLLMFKKNKIIRTKKNIKPKGFVTLKPAETIYIQIKSRFK